MPHQNPLHLIVYLSPHSNIFNIFFTQFSTVLCICSLINALKKMVLVLYLVEFFDMVYGVTRIFTLHTISTVRRALKG